MKILHIVPTYYPAVRYGGPIKTVHELNKELVKQGAEVTVYTTNIDGRNNLNVLLGKPVDVDGVKVYYFPATFRPWQYSFSLHRALAKNLKSFDLVHITSVFLAASTLGAYYAKKFKKTYVISPRGSLMSETLKKKSFKKSLYLNIIEKCNLKKAVIHFTTEMEKKEYIGLKLPLRDSIVIPNGINTGELDKNVPAGYFREKFNIAQDAKVILFLSRLSWKKGLDTLIPAFVEVIKKEPKAILVLAGGDDEGYKKDIQLLITDYQLQNKVIFTGMIGGDDKIAAYQDSDVFVLPSYAENFGNVVLEAAYLGLPVVVTEGVAISSEIEKAGVGIVVKKEVKELAEAIFKVLNDSALALKMGQSGKKLAETEFIWPRIATEFIRAYDRIIKDKLK